MQEIVTGESGQDFDTDFVVFDIETTGFSPVNNRIIEIGAVKVKDGEPADVFKSLVNPGLKLPEFITEVTGITDDLLEGERQIKEVLPEFIEFCDTDVVMGHNLMFDYSFIKVNAVNLNLEFDKSGIDTLKIAKKHLAGLESRKLDYLCSYYGIEDKEHHRAYNDAMVTSRLYLKLAEEFETPGDTVFKPYKLAYKSKKQSPITEKQKVYLLDLIKYHRIDFKSDISMMTKSEASRWIDKILSTYGRIF